MSPNVSILSQTWKVYPHCFDPRQGCTAKQLLALTHLHLLLFKELVVQDNFLISKLFYQLTTIERPNVLRDLIENEWLRIALRKGPYSLTALKDQLLQDTHKGRYLPFEERAEGITLYKAEAFKNYLENLDRSLATENAILSWVAHDMGTRYREAMKRSAEEGTSGLPADRALEIWATIDTTVARSGPHSRSIYYDYAESLSARRLANQIRNWARLQYMKILPRSLGLDISVPRTTLTSIEACDPFAELSRLGAHSSDYLMIRGRDCAMLNPNFLLSLSIDDIRRLRALPEFGHLHHARESRDSSTICRALAAYLRAIGENAAAVYAPFRERIERLSAQVRLKSFLALVGRITAPIVVVTIQADPVMAAVLGALSVALPSLGGTEDNLAKVEKQAVADLEDTRFSRDSISFIDFCHEVQHG